jgi:hypothetical protein
MSATEETALRNEIKMQNERIGVDSEVLNIEATWGGSIMEGRG